MIRRVVLAARHRLPRGDVHGALAVDAPRRCERERDAFVRGREVEEDGGGRHVGVRRALGIGVRAGDARSSGEMDNPGHRGHRARVRRERVVLVLVDAVEVVDAGGEVVAAREEPLEARAVAGVASREHQPGPRSTRPSRGVGEHLEVGLLPRRRVRSAVVDVIHRDDLGAGGEEALHEMAPDEPRGAGDQPRSVLSGKSLFATALRRCRIRARTRARAARRARPSPPTRASARSDRRDRRDRRHRDRRGPRGLGVRARWIC